MSFNSGTKHFNFGTPERSWILYSLHLQFVTGMYFSNFFYGLVTLSNFAPTLILLVLLSRQ